jgi:esterase/lipase
VGVPIEQIVAGEADLGVLLLHGLTGTTAEMMPVAEALLGRYPLWLARVAGHETSVGELARTSWEEWYASATAGADALLRDRCRGSRWSGSRWGQCSACGWRSSGGRRSRG